MSSHNDTARSPPIPESDSSISSTESSDTESEPPEIVKIPPTRFIWGEDRIRKMLPRRRLPCELDISWVDIKDPTELPLCWFGVPFSSAGVLKYAKKYNLVTLGPRDPGSGRPNPTGVYQFQAWAELIMHFRKESGLQLELQDVWGRDKAILVFFTNRDTEWITTRHIHEIQYLLWDMDYPAEIPFKWYLDKRELF